MKFAFDLLKVDQPMFDRIIFPRKTVEAAIDHAYAHPPLSGGWGRVVLEVCRYETMIEPNFNPEQDEHMARLSMSGRLLEVIGGINKMWVAGDTLKATGEIVSNLAWATPYEDHKPVPYLEMKARHEGTLRVITSFTFTEVVMVHQTVTRLALRKFSERKSLLAVDKRP